MREGSKTKILQNSMTMASSKYLRMNMVVEVIWIEHLEFSWFPRERSIAEEHIRSSS